MSAVISPEKRYLDYRDKVEGHIRSHVQNEHDRHDLAQQAFLKAIAAKDAYDPLRSTPGTWLYTIHRNVVTDYCRAGSRKPILAELDANKVSDGADDRLLTEETLDALAAALKRLPERERNIVIWRVCRGISPQEIAEKPGISYANVRFLQHSALKKLRRRLTETELF